MKIKIIGFLVLLVAVIASCESDRDIEFKRYYTGGQMIYRQKCQNCHGEHGEGLSSLMPPLTDLAYLKTNKAKLACYVTNGVKGKMMVINGKTYIGDMPPADLAPIEVAKVLTYLTNSFGNKMQTINVEHVEADLAKCE